VAGADVAATVENCREDWREAKEDGQFSELVFEEKSRQMGEERL
jgi:hypothetical protein